MNECMHLEKNDGKPYGSKSPSRSHGGPVPASSAQKKRHAASVNLLIFSWVQIKFNGRQERNRFDAGMSLLDLSSDNSVSDKLKQEPNDWPQALLAIGTFGNNKLKEEPHQMDDHPQNLHCSDDLTDFSVEEVNKLQQELKKLLIRKSKSTSSTGADIVEEDKVNLPFNRFLNCPSSLEVDRTASAKFESLEDESNGDLSPNTTIVLHKLKNMLLGNHNVIKKKPISFLPRKIFVRGNGFTPAPSLRDLIPESRMDKILRAILTKTVHQQNSAPISSKTYLENKPKEQAHEEEDEEEGRKKTKWVKTDSEFIVLEI